MRGHGKFNAVQIPVQPVAVPSNVVNAGMQSGNQQSQGYASRPLDRNQCGRCRGWGHWAYQCPTPARGRRGQMRGRRGGCGRGRRGGRGAGPGQPSNVNAALQVSDAGAPGPSVQQVQGAAPVPSQQQGN